MIGFSSLRLKLAVAAFVAMLLAGDTLAQRVNRSDDSRPVIRGKDPDLYIPDITASNESGAGSVPSGPTVEVTPEFQPGCTYRFISQLEVRLQFPVRGTREAIVEQQSRFDAGIRKDGKPGMSLRGRTERLKVELKSKQELVKYDSLDSNDRQTPLGQHLNQSLTQWVDLKLNKEHRIVSEELGGKTASASPLEGFPQFGTGDLRQTVSVILQGMPEKPVRPGQRWEVKGVRRLTEAGEMAFDIQFRFRGEVMHEHNRYLQIDLSGEASGDVGLPTKSVEGAKPVLMSFQVPSLSGRILYDPLEKMVRLTEQTVSMTVEIPGGPGVPPLRVPMQQKSKTTLLHIVPTP